MAEAIVAQTEALALFYLEGRCKDLDAVSRRPDALHRRRDRPQRAHAACFADLALRDDRLARLHHVAK